MQKNTPQAIIAMLTRDEKAASIVIAPGGPAVLRCANSRFEVMDTIMTPKDVGEILVAFRNYGQVSDAASKQATGSFAFPVPKVGRFRVNYMTQRGSYVLTVTRASAHIPTWDALLDITEPAQRLLDSVKSSHVSLVTLIGTVTEANTDFVYALLQQVNATTGLNRLICTVEPNLRYLMRHNYSIVVQCEADTDAPSVEAGIRNVLGLRPDILYVGGVQTEGELALIRTAVSRGITTLVSSTSLSHAVMGGLPHADNGKTATDPFNRRWLRATLTPLTGGKFSVSLDT